MHSMKTRSRLTNLICWCRYSGQIEIPRRIVERLTQKSCLSSKEIMSYIFRTLCHGTCQKFTEDASNIGYKLNEKWCCDIRIHDKTCKVTQIILSAQISGCRLMKRFLKPSVHLQPVRFLLL